MSELGERGEREVWTCNAIVEVPLLNCSCWSQFWFHFKLRIHVVDVSGKNFLWVENHLEAGILTDTWCEPHIAEYTSEKRIMFVQNYTPPCCYPPDRGRTVLHECMYVWPLWEGPGNSVYTSEIAVVHYTVSNL